MPAKDIFHDHVKAALIKDGWTVTDDPLKLKWGKKKFFVDLGAERIIIADKANRRIGVEVKSFVGRSDMADLEDALGQFVLYHDVLAKVEPDRTLYLAINDAAYETVFSEPIGQLLLENKRLKLIVFDPSTKEILRWIT